MTHYSFPIADPPTAARTALEMGRLQATKIEALVVEAAKQGCGVWVGPPEMGVGRQIGRMTFPYQFSPHGSPAPGKGAWQFWAAKA